MRLNKVCDKRDLMLVSSLLVAFHLVDDGVGKS